jgi:hypothetical protein
MCEVAQGTRPSPQNLIGYMRVNSSHNSLLRRPPEPTRPAPARRASRFSLVTRRRQRTARSYKTD